jgi:hypothetical protein
MTQSGSTMDARVFLVRRSQRMRESGPEAVQIGTARDRERGILPRAAQGARGAGLRPAHAGAGEERA